MKGDASLTAMDNFLLKERKGYCDFYASAACLMLRLADVPTRVALWLCRQEFHHPKTEISPHRVVPAHGSRDERLPWRAPPDRAGCDFTPAENAGNLNERSRTMTIFSQNAYEAVQAKQPEPPEEKAPEEFSLTKWWTMR